MGFSTIVAHVVLFVGLLAAGGTLSATLLNTADEMDQVSRDEWLRLSNHARTNIEVTGAAWNNGPKTVTVTVKNTGSTTLDAGKVTLLMDGVFRTPASIAVEGDSTQRVWAPSQNAVFVVSINPKPTKVTVATENGIINSRTVV